MFAFSLGTILTSTVSVYYRDFEHLIVALTRILFWVTPIFYMIESLSGVLQFVIWFNPLTYYVRGLQDIMYWGIMPSVELIVACTAVSSVSLAVGLYVFEKFKDGFAERI